LARNAFFKVRSEAEQMRAAGELESDIPRKLGPKYGRTPDGIRYILHKEEPPKWVFMNEQGKHLDPHNFVNRIFKKVLVKAGLRQIRFHDLRHTFASLLIQNKESLAYVKEQMGHHSIQVTVDIWAPGSWQTAALSDRLDDPRPAATPAQPTPPPTAAPVAVMAVSLNHVVAPEGIEPPTNGLGIGISSGVLKRIQQFRLC